VSKRFIVSQVIDSNDFDISSGGSYGTKVISTDATKTINSDTYAHDQSPLLTRNGYFRVQAMD
jgi:hypothetical protein